jgi:hypothetical protein
LLVPSAIAKITDICLIYYGQFSAVKRRRALSLLLIKVLAAAAAFAALVLVAALQGLSASGHFPRAKDSRSGPGTVVLLGSIALGALSLAPGTVAALVLAPWYAVVIAGGLAVLAAPLVLQLFSDRFVDGHGALLVFAAAAGILAILLIALAIGPFHKTPV